MATNLDCYEDDLQFILLLNRCGLAGTQQEKITADGFTSMRILVDHYNFDPNNGFANYVRDLNATLGNASNAERRVYYSPILIVKLSGIVRYFIISVYSFHKLPDISQEVNADVIALQAQLYSEVKRLKYNPDKSKEDNDAMPEKKLPSLLRQSNWVIFLSHLPSRRSVHSLAYLVNEE